MKLTVEHEREGGIDHAVESPVHQLPKAGERLPCCGRAVYEIPRTDRVASNPKLVTCDTFRRERRARARATLH